MAVGVLLRLGLISTQLVDTQLEYLERLSQGESAPSLYEELFSKRSSRSKSSLSDRPNPHYSKMPGEESVVEMPESPGKWVDYSGFDKNVLNRMREDFAAKFTNESIDFAKAIFDTTVKRDLQGRIVAVAGALDYLGFDPILLIKKLAQKAAEAQSTDTFQVTLPDNDVMHVPKGGDLQFDLALFLTLFVVRGASAYKILTKIRAEWKEVLEHKFNTYGISTSRVPQKNMTPDTVTLARIASCAPHHVMALMEKGIGRVYIPHTVLEQAFGIKIPKACLTQSFAGMIPSEGPGSGFIKFAYLYSYLFDRVINSTKQIKDFEAHIKELQRYVDIAINSKLYEDDFRRFTLKTFGLLDQGSGPTVFLESKIGTKIQKGAESLWSALVESTDLTQAKSKYSN